MKLNKVMK